MAFSTKTSNVAALAACNAIADLLDEGTGAAVISIYSGTKPAGPDVALSGQTLLARLVCSDPAFGDAADIDPGARATAGAIADEDAALATGTATWFRASSTNDGATPLNDHIDGEVGLAGADMTLNTVDIVAGAVVSITAWQITMPEG
jgi:hypothetical protein